MKTPQEKNAIRARARSLVPLLTACESCGATEHLERHHPNYDQPDRIEAFCRPCHRMADYRDGTRQYETGKKIGWAPIAARLRGHEVAALDALVVKHGTNRSVYIREVLLSHFERAA